MRWQPADSSRLAWVFALALCGMLQWWPTQLPDGRGLQWFLIQFAAWLGVPLLARGLPSLVDPEHPIRPLTGESSTVVRYSRRRGFVLALVGAAIIGGIFVAGWAVDRAVYGPLAIDRARVVRSLDKVVHWAAKEPCASVREPTTCTLQFHVEASDLKAWQHHWYYLRGITCGSPALELCLKKVLADGPTSSTHTGAWVMRRDGPIDVEVTTQIP